MGAPPLQAPESSPNVPGWGERLRALLVRRWLERDRKTNRPFVTVTLERSLLLFATGLFATGLATSVAAATGTFRLAAPFLLAGWLLAFAGVAWAGARRRLRLKGDWFDVAALVVGGLAFLSAGLLAHHYTQAQMDIGFYVSDAIVISETGGRTLDGPFDPLLPGFAPAPNGGAHVAALFGYTSLAALLAYTFGPAQAAWVNAGLSLVTVLALYAVGRHLGARTGAVVASMFYVSSLLTIWFGRWVMTENAATAVFWVAALLMFSLKNSLDPWKGTALGIAVAFGAAVRPEGILIAAWFGLVLAAMNGRRIRSWWRIQNRRQRTTILGALLLFFLLVLGTYAAVEDALPKAYLAASGELATHVLSGRPTSDAPDVPATGPHPNWGDYALRYQWDSSTRYALHFFLAIAVMGIAAGLVGRRGPLFLGLLALPYLLFVWMPPVTTFHPWFMRRLWIAFIPLVYVLAGATVDPERLGLRWPVRSGGRARPRATLALAAIAATAGLLLVQLDISAPVGLKRESDGVQAFVAQLDQDLPPDAILIVDEDLVAVASAVRLNTGRAVVAWFNHKPASFRASFDAAADAPLYLLRLNSSRQIPVLRTDILGSETVRDYEIPISLLPRYNLRDYLAFAPLERGYAPLADYLESSVPPQKIQETRLRASLVRLERPLILQKNIEFAPGDWERRADGMVALGDNASLLINRSQFRPEPLEHWIQALYLTFPQATTWTRTLQGLDANGTVVGTATIASDGSGQMGYARVALPSPMRLDAIRAPAGTALWGIYFGPWEG